MSNNGKEYEQFVALLHQALLSSETLTEQNIIEVKLNKKIMDSCGVEREFDLYWEYELAGITYKTVIECKDYNKKIPLEKIDALIGKIRDIPDIRAVFATKQGYQSGAEKKARHNKIDLLIVREQNESDWKDIDGNRYIKEIHINMTIRLPARITKFEPLVDVDLNKNCSNSNPEDPMTMTGLTNEIFITDDEGNEFSLYDLQQQLAPKDGSEFGSFSEQVRYRCGAIRGLDFNRVIRGYNIEYEIPEPHSEPIVIDFSKELIGVIEYLQKGMKRSVFKKGIIRENLLPPKR